jgi:uncharacterized protein YtpQ (UPF0354 family)
MGSSQGRGIMRIERPGILGMGLFSLLAACWKPGTAKARPFGDIAEFRQHIMTILKDRHLAENIVADSADPAKFKMTAHGEEGTVNLTGIFGYVQANPGDYASEVERFVRSITYDHNKPIDESDIVAVIRTREYASSLGPQYLREPLVGELVIVYMADEPDALKSLSKKDVPGKSLADVRRVAFENVRKWLPKVGSNGELGDGVLYYVEGNELLSISLILLDDFWKSVAARFPGDVLIALPRKDQLFVFNDDGNAASRAGIRRLIDVTFEDNFNLLSRQLYARRGGKIVAVTD